MVLRTFMTSKVGFSERKNISKTPRYGVTQRMYLLLFLVHWPKKTEFVGWLVLINLYHKLLHRSTSETYNIWSRCLLNHYHTWPRLLALLNWCRITKIDIGLHIRLENVFRCSSRQCQGNFLSLRFIAKHVISLKMPDGFNNRIKILSRCIRSVQQIKPPWIFMMWGCIRRRQPLHLYLRFCFNSSFQYRR